MFNLYNIPRLHNPIKKNLTTNYYSYHHLQQMFTTMALILNIHICNSFNSEILVHYYVICSCIIMSCSNKSIENISSTISYIINLYKSSKC